MDVDPKPAVLRIADIDSDTIVSLLENYGLSLSIEDDGAAITGSYWGESEAGIVGTTVYVRRDTPVHSLLHETGHIICMSADRRAALHRDAGSDDHEEAAVCYLQVVLAGSIAGVGRERLLADMDAWGYSFPCGNTRVWFLSDAADAKDFLVNHQLLDQNGRPTFQLRA